MEPTPQFDSAHWVRKLHMVRISDKLKTSNFSQSKILIQVKIICLIFSNFLNQCQVHIYRKADAFHKTGEEAGRGAAAVLLLLHLEENLKFKPSLLLQSRDWTLCALQPVRVHLCHRYLVGCSSVITCQ